MDASPGIESSAVAPDTESLTTYVPVPGFGLLAVNAYLIRAAQPILVDTGLVGMREAFMDRLRAIIPPSEIAWVWLTHADPGHVGNLEPVLAEAPRARLVTTYLGMGKLGLHMLPTDRAYLLNPGQALDVGDRHLVAMRPPTYDAPESTGFQDTKTGVLFSVDCFGALVTEPADSAADIAPADLRNGLGGWAGADSPWMHLIPQDRFDRSLDAIRQLAPSVILSSHLAPASGMTDTLLEYLSVARSAPPFMGPDQAALEAMMSGAGSPTT
jgi:glyoxylase-like metal-dependent hydrolase (beta-lactamase superfamily II)